jgi:hypothetical protein
MPRAFPRTTLRTSERSEGKFHLHPANDWRSSVQDTSRNMMRNTTFNIRCEKTDSVDDVVSSQNRAGKEKHFFSLFRWNIWTIESAVVAGTAEGPILRQLLGSTPPFC